MRQEPAGEEGIRGKISNQSAPNQGRDNSPARPRLRRGLETDLTSTELTVEHRHGATLAAVDDAEQAISTDDDGQ
jgi:hypothetical protein